MAKYTSVLGEGLGESRVQTWGNITSQLLKFLGWMLMF